MNERQQKVAHWARQMGVSEQELRQFLERTTRLDGPTATETLETAAFFVTESEPIGWPDEDGTATMALDSMDALRTDASEEFRSTESSPSTEPIPNQWLGRYEDLGLLGIGGMGEVRKVRDPALRRVMAMKIIHREMMSRPHLISRFIEEAQVGAQLQHPNIVPIYEIGQLPDGRHYFTMKQIRGSEFSAKIRSVHAASTEEKWRPAADGTSFRELIRIHQQVCETVAYAHSHRVIHRDLKPDNIMIGGFGEVLVVDWGLAKVLGREAVERVPESEECVETDRSRSDAMQTRMGSVAGTPCYMAPEQAYGRTSEVGTATDVYTLGVILYEILSGHPPFQGESAEEVLEKVKTDRPVSLKGSWVRTHPHIDSLSEEVGILSRELANPISAVEKIPDGLVEICESAMARNIADRITSALEMAVELKAWLEGAEKREKGLEQVAVATQLVQEALAAEGRSAEEWRAAEAALAMEGASSPMGWVHWEAHRQAASEARQLRRRHERRLHAALVYAPSLEEAHEALAHLRMAELIEATATGDGPRQEMLRQQLHAHWQALSNPTKNALEQELEAGCRDVIVGQRLRRGALVGRHHPRERVSEQVREGARWLTLLGTAGVGKTRLALEMADELKAGFSRTVFCDLTQASDAMDVALHLSRALDVRLRDTDPVHHLAQVLAMEPTLLVLDNMEQLTDVLGPLCGEWFAASEDLQILATSRSRLGVAEERVVSIQPLGLLESVDLFVRRGQVQDRRFELTPQNRERVCALVKKLDGLPLAIELAAARLNLFTVEELTERLTERFSLLRSRGRDAQTLDGALHWSWDLLQPWGKAALSQASLFRGGFTLSAAEGVIAAGADKKAPAMFDILGELVDNSLLRKDHVEGVGNRYSLLESIRAYAFDQLKEPGELNPELQGPVGLKRAQMRHADHFGRLGTGEALKGLDGFGGGEHWDLLYREFDNLVVGVTYGAPKSAARCGMAALRVLGMKGPVSLGVDIATQLLAMKGIGTREHRLLEIERSKCLRISGRMSEARAMVSKSNMDVQDRAFRSKEAGSETPRPESVALDERETSRVERIVAKSLPEIEPPSETFSEARRELILAEAERLVQLGRIELDRSQTDPAQVCFEQALGLFRQYADRQGELSAWSGLGTLYRERGEFGRSMTCFQEALTIAREGGNLVGQSSALNNLAMIHRIRGLYDSAVEYYEESIDIAHGLGHHRAEAIALGNLGNVKRAQGDFAGAVNWFARAIEILRKVGDKANEAHHLGNLGAAYSGQGQIPLAIESHEHSLRLAREIGNTRLAGIQLGNIGGLLAERNENAKAEASLREAISICESTLPMAAGAFRGTLALLMAREGNGAEAQGLLELGEPQIESVPEEYAKFLCKKGEVLWLLGDRDGAQIARLNAQRIAEELNFSAHSDVGMALESLKSLLSAGETGSLGTEQLELALVEAERLLELGRIEWGESQYAQAQECFEQSIAAFRAHGHRAGEAQVLGNLGSVFQEQGQQERAIEMFDQSIRLAREVGDKRTEGMYLGNLGNVYADLGQTDRAIEHYRQSLDIARELGDERGLGTRLGNLGTVCQDQGRYEEAVEYYSQSIDSARKTGDQRSLGNRLSNLGTVYQAQGEFERAIDAFNESIALVKKIGDQRSEGIHLGNLGDALFKLKRTSEAEVAFRRAIAIVDTFFAVAAGAFRGSLALLLAQQNQFDEAVSLLERGEPQVQRYPEEHAKFLCKKGQVYRLAKDLTAAQSALTAVQALVEKSQIAADSEVGRLVGELAHSLRS